MKAILTVAISLFANLAMAQSFFVGNSLTWDTVPELIPDSDWSIFCGKSLNYIVDNPDGFCVSSSMEWPDALSTTLYDTVVVQPYLGDTVASAIEDISNFMALQPTAQFILHTGWAGQANLLSDYASGTAVHSPEFFSAVMAGLPRPTTRTNAMDALVFIANDPNSPYTDISELYRDPLHLTIGDGRYLAHNLVRRAMGLPYRTSWIEPIVHQDYLDELLARNDYDWDGDTDGADFLAWQRAYSGGPPFTWGGSSALVASLPEPSTITLLFCGMFLQLRRPRRFSHP